MTQNLMILVPNFSIGAYREVEEKITGTMPSNLKFDDSEGKAKNWSLLRHCCFISCFTMLSTNDFKDGILDLGFAEK